MQSGTSATHGTPEYLAPEVVAGNTPTLPADVYALGIVLYELVSGRSPFRGGPVHEVLRRQQECVAVQPAGMPEQLWQQISQCLERDPRLRPSAAELAVSLRILRPSLNGMPAAAPMPDHVKTYRQRPVGVETSTPVAGPVSPAPISPAPISPAPVSALPGLSGPVSPAVIGTITPPPPGAGVPANDHHTSVMPAAHHTPGMYGPASHNPAGLPPVQPWEIPAESSKPDFLTAVLAAQGVDAPPPPAAPPTKRRRGNWIAGAVGAVAAAVLVVFVATLLLVGGGDKPTDTKQPPAASDEREEAQPPAPSASPSREPSPSPEPTESTPPRPSQPPQDPGDDGSDDGGDDGDDNTSPSQPQPGEQMPTLPTKPSFPR